MSTKPATLNYNVASQAPHWVKEHAFLLLTKDTTWGWEINLDFSKQRPEKEENIRAGIENCLIRIAIKTKLVLIAGVTTGILNGTIAGNIIVGFSRN